MSVRYFDFIEGKSSKFWQIGWHDNQVTVRFGRIGTAGQTRVKSFPDAQAAERHVAKLVAQKTKKGYREAVAS